MLRREVWEKREVENVRDGEGVVGAGTFVYSVYCVEFPDDFTEGVGEGDAGGEAGFGF